MKICISYVIYEVTGLMDSSNKVLKEVELDGFWVVNKFATYESAMQAIIDNELTYTYLTILKEIHLNTHE